MIKLKDILLGIPINESFWGSVKNFFGNPPPIPNFQLPPIHPHTFTELELFRLTTIKSLVSRLSKLPNIHINPNILSRIKNVENPSFPFYDDWNAVYKTVESRNHAISNWIYSDKDISNAYESSFSPYHKLLPPLLSVTDVIPKNILDNKLIRKVEMFRLIKYLNNLIPSSSYINPLHQDPNTLEKIKKINQIYNQLPDSLITPKLFKTITKINSSHVTSTSVNFVFDFFKKYYPNLFDDYKKNPDDNISDKSEKIKLIKKIYSKIPKSSKSPELTNAINSINSDADIDFLLAKYKELFPYFFK